MDAETARAQLELSLVTSPSFGTLVAGSSGRQFVVNADNTVTGTDAGDYVSGALAAGLEVNNPGAPVSLNIVVENISTSGGITLNQALCVYDGGSQKVCDGAGITETSGTDKPLSVGLDVSTTSTHSGGQNASVSYDVVVTIL